MTTAIIQPTANRVKFDGPRDSVLIHRDTIANIAQALMLAASDNDTRRGIALLALALGCDVNEGR